MNTVKMSTKRKCNKEVTELKNTLGRFNIRLEEAEERITELEDRARDTHLIRAAKRMKNSEDKLRDFWDTCVKVSWLDVVL